MRAIAPLARASRLIASAVFLVLASQGAGSAGSLQDMIDKAAEGATIAPPAGVYEEHLVIAKSIVLDGSAGVIIDGGGKGTVVELSADGATIKSLTIRNSGRLHNALDAGLRVKGDFNVVKDVTIENSLFGLDMHQADNNIIRRNIIGSKDMPLELRGDSVRLWYSHANTLEENTIHDARDFVVWYSGKNVIRDNVVSNGRYGVHFMYAHENTMTNNTVQDCVIGVFLMYSNDIVVRGNKLLRSWGASGMGVGFKEASGVVIADNDIIGNASGIYIDISPYDPDAINRFENNRIAYNGIGVEFHTDWQGNVFTGNGFMSNFTQIAVRGAGTALRESWEGNFGTISPASTATKMGKATAPTKSTTTPTASGWK
ncbi:MAG: nitrous oxide reductase family maturation protein NosD [Phyllobacteriaceae bacterium]|nr:nitrous oxide reductase family maturation protein NosD [Phyllobacteriaceae bacterium]